MSKSIVHKFLISELALILTGLCLLGCNSTSTETPITTLAEVPEEKIAEQSAAQVETVEQENKFKPDQVIPNQPEAAQPTPHTVRKASAPSPQTVPQVYLSTAHANLCKLRVGDDFPMANLPGVAGKPTELKSLLGQQATVVLLWQPDRWMAELALSDIERDIVKKSSYEQVGVVGIAVKQPAGAVQAAVNQAKATFPQLLDSDGKLFASVGSITLPRVYVLDATGKIVWFDIEYSEGTRREMLRTVEALTAQK